MSRSLAKVKDDNVFIPDSSIILDRLNPLIVQTADDIKACSNVCDIYMKKSLLAKVMSGPLWDAKLLGFVKLFRERRQAFVSALTLDANSKGDNTANVNLDDIERRTQTLNEKFSFIIILS
jgi:hypothetical protein